MPYINIWGQKCRGGLIGENSIEYVDKLIYIWNSGNCAVPIDCQVPIAYSAAPEHPKPQPLCTETAQIAHRRRDHYASKTHAQVNPRRDFSTARAARSAGVACGKVSAAILPAASSMQPHHKQLCLRDHAHPFSHGFLAFNHDPIRIVHAPVAYRIGNQRIPDLVTPTGNIKL